MKRMLIALGSLAMLNLVLISAGVEAGKKWVVPAEFVSKKNSVAVSDDGLDDGKELWNKECKICHGSKGAGDGVKAKNLATSCGDLTTNEFQTSLTDGGIYYLTFVKDIHDHTFAKKISDETDRWNLVHYIRTLKK